MAEQEKLDFRKALRLLIEAYQNDPEQQESVDRHMSCVMQVRCEVSIYPDLKHPGSFRVAVDSLPEDVNIDAICFDSNEELEAEEILDNMVIDPTVKQWELSTLE